MSDTKPTILIIGASRGLGLGLTAEFLTRGWQVVATERSQGADLAALRREAGEALRIETLDIDEEASATVLDTRLAGTTLDILFVNAGVIDDKRPIGTVDTAEFTRLLVTNALSPLRMVERFAARVAPEGVIGAMSSGLGSVATNTSGGYDVYRASKAALNTLLRSYAARDGGRAVLAVSPGWVKTDMGGDGATLDVATATRGIADVLIARQGKPGGAFLDYRGQEVPW